MIARWKSTGVPVGIVLVIALIHLLRAGTYLPGTLRVLLCVPNVRAHFGDDWRLRALVVFAAACAAEILQGCGVPFLGRTFDPVDFPMFAVGVSLAVLVERRTIRDP